MLFLWTNEMMDRDPAEPWISKGGGGWNDLDSISLDPPRSICCSIDASTTSGTPKLLAGCVVDYLVLLLSLP